MTASVTLHDTTSDWTGATGTSRLPDYAVGDLLVMVYAFAGASSVSIDDGSWTELYQDQLGSTSYTAAGPTGDHRWFYGSACIAVWYKIATNANGGTGAAADINGPGVTPSTGNLSGAGVTYAFRHSDPATWPSPPILAGSSDSVNATQVTLSEWNAGAHNVVTVPGVSVASGLNYFMFVQAVHAQGTGAISGNAGDPPSLGMTQITDAQDFPVVSEGVGTNSTEGIEFQTWRRIGDGSGGPSGSIGPLEAWFGRVDLNQFGDFVGEYYLIPGGARAFVVLAEPVEIDCYVSYRSKSATWVIQEGGDTNSYLPAWDAGDLVVLYYMIDDDVTLTNDDPSWTEAFQVKVTNVSPPEHNAFSTAAAWYKIMDVDNGTVNLPGPGLTVAAGGEVAQQSLGVGMAFHALDAETFDPVTWNDPPVSVGSAVSILAENRGTGGGADTTSIDPPATVAPLVANNMWLTFFIGGGADVIGGGTSLPGMSLVDDGSNGASWEGASFAVQRTLDALSGGPILTDTFDPPAATGSVYGAPYIGEWWLPSEKALSIVLMPNCEPELLAYWGILAVPL